MYGSAHNILHCLFPDMSAQDWKATGHKVTTQAKRLKAKKQNKTRGIFGREYHF